MPTYEYACRACGHTFDVVQTMTDEPLKECPECGGELRKVFHPASISFKGSGFYATDNRKKPASAGTDSAKKDATPSGSGPGTGSSDAKGGGKDDAKGSGKTESKKETKTSPPSTPAPKPASKP